MDRCCGLRRHPRPARRQRSPHALGPGHRGCLARLSESHTASAELGQRIHRTASGSKALHPEQRTGRLTLTVPMGQLNGEEPDASTVHACRSLGGRCPRRDPDDRGNRRPGDTGTTGQADHGDDPQHLPGADINRPVEAALTAQAQGNAAEEIVAALAIATDETRRIVDETNFPVRSKLLAREIATAKPDLVGLQEVALWRSGPLELDKVGVPNATTVEYDFLATLLADLRAAGALRRRGRRRACRCRVPELHRDDGQPARRPTDDARRHPQASHQRDHRDRRARPALRPQPRGGDLRRDDGLLTRLPVGGRPNGWVILPVRQLALRGVQLGPRARAGHAGGRRGDGRGPHDGLRLRLQLDPLLDAVKPHDTVPHKAPYEFLTGPAGYTDQWLEWAPAEEGWTSGLSERVNDASAARELRPPDRHGLRPPSTGNRSTSTAASSPVTRPPTATRRRASGPPTTRAWSSASAGGDPATTTRSRMPLSQLGGMRPRFVVAGDGAAGWAHRRG